jgi:hypothetical protein
MKKRDFLLFCSFVLLFVLFALFQNFSFIQQLPMDGIPRVNEKIKHLQFFRPYFFKEAIGNLETPVGFKSSLPKANERIVFDHKKYFEDMFHESPLYNDLKDIVDFSEDSAGSRDSRPCTSNPSAHENNCYVEYDSMAPSHPGMRFRTNPLRKTASVSYDGDINSQLSYDGGANLEFKKQLTNKSNLKLELKSQDQYGGSSGSVNLDVKW